MGVLAAVRGGADSPLGRALRRLGLSADDIAVVSKHDTSTELNDTNEADLHERIQGALGRTPGNPLLVVSQKTVTGHAKGGAAVWQVDGILRMMRTGVVPGNRNLESADPLLRDGLSLTLGDRPIVFAPQEPIRAGLVTSLGFGHVSALLAIAHPDTFLAAVPAERRADYLRRAGRRRAEGVQQRLRTRLGRPAPVRRADRRLGGDDPAARARRRRRCSRTRRRACAPTAPTRRHRHRRDDARGRPRRGHDHDLRRAARRHRVGVRRRDVHRARAARRVRRRSRPRRAPGARYAAKEAFVKAWSGARAGRPPLLQTVDLREIEVVDDGHGRPALRLHGEVAASLQRLATELDVAGPLHTHLSLSHDPPTAAAVVLLSAP